jgi:type IV pilus assembly protein PilY1
MIFLFVIGIMGTGLAQQLPLSSQLPGNSSGSQLLFSQMPSIGNSSPNVLPNVILAIDDSGSMGPLFGYQDVLDGTQYVYRIQAMKDALKQVFGSGAFIGKIRLAYEAMWDNRGFGPYRLFQPVDDNGNSYDNSMRVFDNSYQINFLNWVDTLTGNGDLSGGLFSTPSQLMIAYAGEYLKGNVLSSNVNFNNTIRIGSSAFVSIKGTPVDPWYEESSGYSADFNPLACRRAYFIFLTAGMWNEDENFAADGKIQYIYMPYVSDVSGGTVATDANYDGHVHSMPTALTHEGATYSQYDPGQPYGALYADHNPLKPLINLCPPISVPGTESYNPKASNHQALITNVYNPNCSSTLSDFALYYWMTDLTGAGGDVLDSASAMTAGSLMAGSKTYDAIWNPENDPATWQHMQTYTIGFGTSANQGSGQINAMSLPAIINYDPLTALATEVSPQSDYIGFDNEYGKFFLQLASGSVPWPATSAAIPEYLNGTTGGMEFWPPLSTIPNINALNPANLFDLVHAAYNGRGRFYPATSTSAVSEALMDIIDHTIAAASGGVSAAADSSRILTSNSMVYVASYAYQPNTGQYKNNTWGTVINNTITGTINGWSGTLVAAPVSVATDPATNLITVNIPVNPSGTLSANGWVASIPPVRNIFTTMPAVAEAVSAGIPFDWINLNVDDSNNTDPSGITQDDVTSVRNDPLGDIVDSQIAFVDGPSISNSNQDPTYAMFVNYLSNTLNRHNVVYVGANDGLLHGFDAGQSTQTNSDIGTGQEIMAYLPRGLLANFSASLSTSITNPNYFHHFWVDGSPFSGDAQINPGTAANPGSNPAINPGGWATVLVGTLGAGGPGYFVLDVTDPSKFVETNANARQMVLTDMTDLTYGPAAIQKDQYGNSVTGYIGYQFNQPVMNGSTSGQIVQINTTATNSSGTPIPEWAVIMGNGYNNQTGLPVLLIQSLSQRDANGDLKIYTVSASCYYKGVHDSSNHSCVAAGNGLSAPRPIDVDGNGTVDIVYAGDLMGNLWKFDISSPDHTQWKVAYNEPMFTATGPGGAVQPITDAPLAEPNPVHGGFMVAFGTGENLTAADATSQEINTIYTLWDSQIPSERTVPINGTSTIIPQVNFDDSQNDFESFSCLQGTGAGRYASCLYSQTGGALTHSDASNPGVSVGLSGANNKGLTWSNGSGIRGWYYDIPEAGAKVLANPQLGANDTLWFQSTVLPGTTTSGNSVSNDSGSENAIIESCTRATSNSAQLTWNLFGLFAGNPPINTITVNGVQYNANADTLKYNRFKINGTSIYLPNGSLPNGAEGVQGVGGKSSIVEVNASLPSKTVGWHFGQ